MSPQWNGCEQKCDSGEPGLEKDPGASHLRDLCPVPTWGHQEGLQATVWLRAEPRLLRLERIF